MVKINNLVKSRLYYLSRISLIKLLIIISVISVLLSLLFLRVEDGQLFVTMLSRQLSVILTNGLLTFAVPLYLFIYLFSCIIVVEYMTDKQEVSSLLAKNVTRTQQYASVLYLLFIYVVIVSLLIYLIPYLLYSSHILLFVQIALLHIIIFSQIQLLFSLRISKNAILLVYLLFFAFFPAFYQEILKVVLVKMNSQIIINIIEYYFITTSIHYDIIRDIGKGINSVHNPSGILNYILYIIVLNVFAGYSFIRKQYA